LIIVIVEESARVNLSRMDSRVLTDYILIYILEQGSNKKVTIHAAVT